MKWHIFILYYTVGVLLLVACATSKPQDNKNRAVSATPICIANLKADIQQHWHKVVHRRMLSANKSHYHKNDAFSYRVSSAYATCIKQHFRKSDVVNLFGAYTFEDTALANNYLYYQCIDTADIAGTVCLIFKIKLPSEIVDTVLYTSCAYPSVRID